MDTYEVKIELEDIRETVVDKDGSLDLYIKYLQACSLNNIAIQLEQLNSHIQRTGIDVNIMSGAGDY